MIGVLKYFFYEDRLRELGLFSLAERRLHRVLTAPFSTWREPTRKRERDVLQECVVIGQGGVALNWKIVGLNWIFERNSLL